MKSAKSVRKSDKSKAGSKHNMLDLNYRSIGNGSSVLEDPWYPPKRKKNGDLYKSTIRAAVIAYYREPK